MTRPDFSTSGKSLLLNFKLLSHLNSLFYVIIATHVRGCSMSSCCLCTVSLVKAKKVKLNGKAASVRDTRLVIASLLREVYEIDYDSSRLSDKDVCICRKCVAEVEEMKKMQAEFNKKKAKVIGFLQPISEESTNDNVERRQRRSQCDDLDRSPVHQFLALESAHCSTTPTRAEKRQPAHVGVNSFIIPSKLYNVCRYCFGIHLVQDILK